MFVTIISFNSFIFQMTLAKYTPEQWEIKQQEKRDKESQNVVTAIKTPRFMKIKRLVKTALLVIALN